jgi:hypothetical protein
LGALLQQERLLTRRDNRGANRLLAESSERLRLSCQPRWCTWQKKATRRRPALSRSRHSVVPYLGTGRAGEPKAAHTRSFFPMNSHATAISIGRPSPSNRTGRLFSARAETCLSQAIGSWVVRPTQSCAMCEKCLQTAVSPIVASCLPPRHTSCMVSSPTARAVPQKPPPTAEIC